MSAADAADSAAVAAAPGSTTTPSALDLALDNTATAASDHLVRFVFLVVYSIAIPVIGGAAAAATLGTSIFASVLLGALAAARPPPPPGAGTDAQIAWRRRRNAGTVALRLVYGLSVNRIVAGAAPVRVALAEKAAAGRRGVPPAAAAAAAGPNSWPAFLAGRHAPMLSFFLSFFSRLPAPVAWAATAVQAIIIPTSQAGACANVLAKKPAAGPYFTALAAWGRQALTLVVAALLGDGLLTPALLRNERRAAEAPDPTQADCVVAMTGLHWAALAAGTASRILPATEWAAAGSGSGSGWRGVQRFCLAAGAAGVAGVAGIAAVAVAGR